MAFLASPLAPEHSQIILSKSPYGVLYVCQISAAAGCPTRLHDCNNPLGFQPSG